MKKSVYTLMVLVYLIFYSTNLISQCNNGTNYYPSTTYSPTDGAWGYASTCNYAGEVVKVNVISGDQYQFSTCGNYGGVTASYDTQITLIDETGTVIAFNDDYSGCSNYTSYIDWTSTYTGVLYVHLNQYNCNSNTICTRVMILRTAPSNNTNSTMVGNPSSTTSDARVPTYGYYDYSWSATLYTTTDLGPTSIIIDKISYDVYNNVSSTMTNQKIYMAYTDDVTFTSATPPQNGDSNLDGWTKVYEGSISWQQGWNEITLDQHFYYDGNRNILIKWENEDGLWESNYPRFRYTSSSNSVIYNYSDNSFPSSTGYINSYKPNMIFNHGGTALPIELLSFDASVIDNSYVNIMWSTASQQINDFFTIETSIDGYEWFQFTKVDGCGNCNTQMNYNVVDESPYKGISYYRLKQTDYDGNSETFHPVSVIIKSERKEVVKIYNQIGQEVNDDFKGLVILLWDNGEITKTINE